MRHQSSMVLVAIALTGLAANSSGAPLPPAPNASEISSAPDITPEQRTLRDRTSGARQTQSRASRATAIAEASVQLQALHMVCNIRDAALVAEMRAAPGGRSSKTYEVACDNGLGYFVVSGEQADAFSCFAADAAAIKDIEQKRTPGVTCALPVNRDVKVMAETMLGNAGFKCSVSNLRWIGINAKAGSEFTETKCADGNGYVLVTAAPGSSAAPSALPCLDALKRGLQCTLTRTAQVNLGMLTDALAARKIACTTDQNSIRVVGQESLKKRYVVEFKCKEHPAGLVAFIPLGDSSAEFESMDCAEAKKHNVMCALK